MENNLRFSIVVPIYNVEKFLDQCITSVLSQKYDNYELILVDDGATDDSGKICDAYALKNDHIRVIHKANGGLVSARRAGVMVAKGEYVGYVDGDDWVADNWLAEVDKVITESHPDIVEYNAFKSTDGKNIEMKTSHFRGFFDEKEVKEKIIPCMLCDKDQRFYTFGVLPAVWSKMIKTEILRDNLCSEDKITFGEDVACIYNSILKCKSFYGIDIPVYYYRQNSQSMTKAYDARRFERLEVLFAYLNKKLLRNNRQLKSQYDNIVNRAGYEATQILDPTMIFGGDRWRKQLLPIHEKGYVLLYQLNANHEIDEYAKQFADKAGLKLLRVSVEAHNCMRVGKFKLCLSPFKFLSYIANAEYMITDSFHGTAFAIMFNRQFVEVLPEEKIARNLSVLKQFGLEDRILNSLSDFSYINQKIDYLVVNKKLKESQELAAQKLKEMMDEV